MKRFLTILVFVLLLACACSVDRVSPNVTQLDTVQPTVASTLAPASATPIQPTVPPTKARVATLTPSNAVPPTQIAVPAVGFTELTLGLQKIRLDVEDMQVVSEANYTLTGQAPAGTVISVNDDFLVVGADRNFSFRLALEEGPNLIEFEASDSQGQSVTLGLVLIYDPSS